jgi:hypothetical protein
MTLAVQRVIKLKKNNNKNSNQIGCENHLTFCSFISSSDAKPQARMYSCASSPERCLRLDSSHQTGDVSEIYRHRQNSKRLEQCQYNYVLSSKNGDKSQAVNRM